MKKFRVDIPVKGYMSIWVSAENKDQAIENALSNYNVLCEPEYDCSFDTERASEVKVIEIMDKFK